MKVPITKTSFIAEDFEKINIPLESGWVVQGPMVREFEQKWSKFSGGVHSIAVSSCTTALHLSLVVAGIKNGDEVIVPSFTWIATANAIEYTGAKPVFCDIDLDTFNIDVRKIEELITPKTRAIIPVHLFGLSAEMDTITDIANRYNLVIIEDAACGFATRYRDKHVGNFGLTGCFSFHPRKAITTGEGGMVITSNEDVATKLRSLRDHGANLTDYTRHSSDKPFLLPEFNILGYNYRMTDIQAALGSAQMDRAKWIVENRRRVAKIYDEFLKGNEILKPPQTPDKCYHSYQSYVCLYQIDNWSIDGILKTNEKRNSFMQRLFEKGISTRPGTHAVHMTQYYSNKYGIKKEDFLNSFAADRCSIALPLYPTMTEEEISYVIENVKKHLKK
ncbi:MAG: DegT/DnrJ/EryC1/StrS family aminotransferase [Ignavibacteria bacterium]